MWKRMCGGLFKYASLVTIKKVFVFKNLQSNLKSIELRVDIIKHLPRKTENSNYKIGGKKLWLQCKIGFCGERKLFFSHFFFSHPRCTPSFLSHCFTELKRQSFPIFRKSICVYFVQINKKPRNRMNITIHIQNNIFLKKAEWSLKTSKIRFGFEYAEQAPATVHSNIEIAFNCVYPVLITLIRHVHGFVFFVVLFWFPSLLLTIVFYFKQTKAYLMVWNKKIKFRKLPTVVRKKMGKNWNSLHAVTKIIVYILCITMPIVFLSFFVSIVD